MTDFPTPYALPPTLEADLATVHAYWRGLIRGKASDMPYWDDVNLSALPALADRLMLVAAFTKPERFRFEIVGKDISASHNGGLAGRFVDEVDVKPPLDFFRAQASATVEGRAPTYYKAKDYARLVLPLWGEGEISMLLCAIARV
ncbi:hypothetical protein [Parvibaculum sp.]|uniref:hypothetical protein n=1 Tax=Parvibaculum sp. TaxID=2024848 RepID=UPI0027317D33|nr:hypothetical protein [Parvibaculum sp.]MDP1627400.1 hypothetical protein [Parvibaculum sp.]MDP2148579.1 hypothetical protein [Parvibaculum sp.]MDP3327536.1 hypothetical protein [Parvibaculum sp.]